MGVFETGLGTALVLVVVVAVWRVFADRPAAMPTDPPTLAELGSAKRRFIAEMNRRILHEPQVAPQLQTLRDMVVGWYELKGPVIGVRFVARSCCETCYGLDGRQLSLMDVRQLVRHVPPVHREHGSKRDCTCTLMPVTVGRGSSRPTKDAIRTSRPVTR